MLIPIPQIQRQNTKETWMYEYVSVIKVSHDSDPSK